MSVMRKIILYIDSMQKGGANRVMANLADYFKEKGADVILVEVLWNTKEMYVKTRLDR